MLYKISEKKEEISTFTSELRGGKDDCKNKTINNNVFGWKRPSLEYKPMDVHTNACTRTPLRVRSDCYVITMKQLIIIFDFCAIDRYFIIDKWWRCDRLRAKVKEEEYECIHALARTQTNYKISTRAYWIWVITAEYAIRSVTQIIHREPFGLCVDHINRHSNRKTRNKIETK